MRLAGQAAPSPTRVDPVGIDRLCFRDPGAGSTTAARRENGEDHRRREALPPSHLHKYYVVLEVLKLYLLVATAWQTARNSQ